jgi:hypothetical protein
VNIYRIILDGLVLSVIASVFIFLTIRLNPRLWLQDYPPDIQSRVPPKTEKEKRLSLIVGIPFLILVFLIPLFSTFMLKSQHQGEPSFILFAGHAFGVALFFNIVDWLVLDWMIFCLITPRFVVLPGSEGAEGYQDYCFHFRGFLVGILFSAVLGAIIGAIVFFGFSSG